jgi:hypothetical protein
MILIAQAAATASPRASKIKKDHARLSETKTTVIASFLDSIFGSFVKNPRFKEPFPINS